MLKAKIMNVKKLFKIYLIIFLCIVFGCNFVLFL